jgi:predicted ATPase
MLLEDRARITVREAGSSTPRSFDHLSTGQQRSILLSLILCADQDDPLVLDQPEDHLDAKFVASAVVGHLELAKERRQLIIATHNANLTVLGDAELVIPMVAENGRGRPWNEGSVDRPETRTAVCEILEGGETAFQRRGRRYGYRVERIV